MNYILFRIIINVVLVNIFLIKHTLSDSVCDLEMLLIELKQDLDDNGRLDCLRIIEPPSGNIETIDEQNKRLAAQWDSSCAFESSNNWFLSLKKNYGVESLVDETFEPVLGNLKEQADMCEIIRALAKSGKLGELKDNGLSITEDNLKYIDCLGDDESFDYFDSKEDNKLDELESLNYKYISKNKMKICAVNGVSFYKKNMWTILLESSAIKVNKLPNFIKEKDSNSKSRTNFNSSYNDIASKYSEFKTDRSDIDVASRIDNPDNDIANIITSKYDLINKDRSRPTNIAKRVSIIFSSFKKETISIDKWSYFNSGVINVKLDYNSLLIVYSMISSTTVHEARLNTRLEYDNIDQISSRMINGYIKNPSITSAFIVKSQIGDHVIKTQYMTNRDIKFNIDSNNNNGDSISNNSLNSNELDHESNLSTGVIIIPYINVYYHKNINTSEVQLFNSNSFSVFPNISLNFKANKSALYLIMYSLTIPGLQSHIVTNLSVNYNEIKESRSISGDSTYLGLHNAVILDLKESINYSINLNYRTPSNLKTNPILNDWEGQNISVLQLPEWFNLKKILIENEFSFNNDNNWNVFPDLDIDLELEDDKSILFMYNVVVPLIDNSMVVGIFVNNILQVSLYININIKNIQKRSVTSYNGKMYFKAFGYFPVKFDSGKYKIHFKYKTNANVNYKPNTDWQIISLSLLDMN